MMGPNSDPRPSVASGSTDLHQRIRRAGSKEWSLAAARHEAQRMSRNILDSHNLLHEIVIRHEDTIKKRWQKKTKPQRLQVLLGIWPDMAKKHHADLEAVLKEGKKSAALKARYRRHMIWPQINQEDLSRPKMLPLLLSSRGRHHPSEFVCTDWFGTYIARGSKSFDFIRIEGHFMIISETMTAEDYAEIFPVNGRPDGANWKYTAQRVFSSSKLKKNY